MAGNKIIAVDLGGTNLRVALIKNNKILEYIKKNTPKEKNSLISEMEDSIAELMNKDVKGIKGIGVGSPGPLKNGIIKNPPNLPLKNFNLQKELEKRFKKKVVIENDAACVALAEARLGCKKKNFVILTFGTGVGGGIIINKKVYHGQGYGGELGHLMLEKEKSFEKLWQETREKMKKTFGENILVKDLLKMKSPESNSMLNNVVYCMGKGIASIINMFDPEIVVLAGGIKETGEPFLKRIKKEAKKYILLPKETPIVWTKLEHPGILGASLLIN